MRLCVCVCCPYLSSFSALLSFFPEAAISPRTSFETAPSRRREILRREIKNKPRLPAKFWRFLSPVLETDLGLAIGFGDEIGGDQCRDQEDWRPHHHVHHHHPPVQPCNKLCSNNSYVFFRYSHMLSLYPLPLFLIFSLFLFIPTTPVYYSAVHRGSAETINPLP